jgi:hypothetical protein
MGLLSSFRAVVAQKMDDNPAVVTCNQCLLSGWGQNVQNSQARTSFFHLASQDTFHFTEKRLS